MFLCIIYRSLHYTSTILKIYNFIFNIENKKNLNLIIFLLENRYDKNVYLSLEVYLFFNFIKY